MFTNIYNKIHITLPKHKLYLLKTKVLKNHCSGWKQKKILRTGLNQIYF